ncbi:diguanylate cyclase [Euzebya sp.]|uniref:diguanylate cyclase n=1 Tax=Euzebya sp. TaxID=1971409 RepID=UPI003517859A
MGITASITPSLAEAVLQSRAVLAGLLEGAKRTGALPARTVAPAAVAEGMDHLVGACERAVDTQATVEADLGTRVEAARLVLYLHATSHWVAAESARTGRGPLLTPHDAVVLASRQWIPTTRPDPAPRWLDALPVGLVRLSPSGFIDVANRCARTQLGLDESTCLFDRLPPDEALWLGYVLTEEGEVSGEAEFRPVEGSSAGLTVRGDVRDANGDDQVGGWVLALRDVSDVDGLQQLQHEASTDELTGLLNRRRFLDRLDAELRRPAELGIPFAVVMIDLDDFKQVNDTHGHEAGDRVLRIVSRRLQRGLRGNDVAARLAGDEFVVLLDDVRQRDAHAVIDRMRHALTEPLSLPDGTLIRVHASFGTAVVPPGDERHGQAVLSAADRAMYADKAQRRSTRARPEVTTPVQVPSEQLDVSATLVQFSRILAANQSVDAILTALGDFCTELLPVDGAGVLLLDDGELTVATTNSPLGDAAEALEAELGDGPCTEAIRTSRPVSVPDLQDAVGRYPTFAPRALAAGIRSVHGVPLMSHEDLVGSLDLIAATPLTISEHQLETVQMLADVAVAYIVTAQLHQEQTRLATQLQHALQSRVVIEQAKGLLAERHGEPPDAAFERLRRHARRHQEKVHAVAERVVAGLLDV